MCNVVNSRVDIRMTQQQKELLSKVAAVVGRKNRTDYIMGALFKQLEKDGYLLKFINNDSDLEV